MKTKDEVSLDTLHAVMELIKINGPFDKVLRVYEKQGETGRMYRANLFELHEENTNILNVIDGVRYVMIATPPIPELAEGITYCFMVYGGSEEDLPAVNRPLTFSMSLMAVEIYEYLVNGTVPHDDPSKQITTGTQTCLH